MSISIKLYLCLFGISCIVLIPSSSLKVGSFNVQIFGLKKIKSDDVVSILVKIIRRYDIMLMMEIRDSSDKAIWNLLDMVNKGVRGKKKKYDILVSERLGKSSSKEQYAFFYRPYMVTPLDNFTYHDPLDVFEREPLFVYFQYKKTKFKFPILGVHIDPDIVVEEMNGLIPAIEKAQSRWKTQDILIAGDFNADCVYLSKRRSKTVLLKQDPAYLWLIPDTTDTTTRKTTNCAYDRLIVKGKDLTSRICKGTADIFRFDDAFKLDYEKTLSVSDHYPVEVDIRTGRRCYKSRG